MPPKDFIIPVLVVRFPSHDYHDVLFMFLVQMTRALRARATQWRHDVRASFTRLELTGFSPCIVMSQVKVHCASHTNRTKVRVAARISSIHITWTLAVQYLVRFDLHKKSFIFFLLAIAQPVDGAIQFVCCWLTICHSFRIAGYNSTNLRFMRS